MYKQIYIINNECPECGVELTNPCEDEKLVNKRALISKECECNNIDN